MSAMVCQSCGEHPATIHLTEITDDDERIELNFCEACATEKGVSNEVAMPSMLAGMVAAAVRGHEAEALRCPHCGITFKEFRRKGRLGCPIDYEVFAEPLAVMLRKMHGGATRHTGRLPRGRLEIESTVGERLLQLRSALQKAITEEAYEEAARIRDEIRAIERGGSGGEVGPEGASGSAAWADPVRP